MKDRLATPNIALSGTGLTAKALPGHFFTAGQTVTVASDALIYDQSHGALWYDADGSGKGAALAVTFIDLKPALTAASLVVV